MSKFSLDNTMNIEVIARFIGKGHEQPVTGGAYRIRLYDKDVFNDDFLGEASPDENGIVRISFSHNAFSGVMHIDDKPDFYFVVYKHKQEIFKTKVMEDVDLERIEKFRMGEGEVVDLGTFLIES